MIINERIIEDMIYNVFQAIFGLYNFSYKKTDIYKNTQILINREKNKKIVKNTG